MSAITVVGAAVPGTGLVVLCLDCTKEFRSSELQGQRCLSCRVHRACAGDREAIGGYIKKQQRYSAVGAIANQEQFLRLQRRLFNRVFGMVVDPRQAQELANTEYWAAVKDTPLNRFLVSREETVALHPDLRRVRVARPRLSP